MGTRMLCLTVPLRWLSCGCFSTADKYYIHQTTFSLHGQQVCPASGLPCNCGTAAKQGVSQAQDGGANSSAHANGSSNGHKVVPAKEPLFPAELKRLLAQELCLPGRCTWLR